jgi:Clostridium epsilon toxin ETX/Bacillus mosquitocidal toxin MTX2
MALVPIYQYHNENVLLHFLYTTQASLDGTSFNSPPKDDLANWISDGVAFYACDQSDPNAIPMYQFYAPLDANQEPSDAQKYLFTNDQNQAGGWTMSSPTPAFYVYSVQDAGLAYFGIWYIDQPQDSFFLGCNPQSAVIGAFVAPSGWQPAGWTPQQFYALPGSAQCSYAIQDLELPTPPPGSPRLVGQQLITNNSQYASIAQDVSYTMSLSSSFTLTFSETLSVTDSKNFQIGLPDVADIQETITFGVTLNSTQAQTTTTSQSVSISSTVTVPPQKSVTATGIVNVLTNWATPVSVDVVVSAESNGVALSAAASSGMPCQALIDLFNQENTSPPYSGTVTPQPAQGAIEVSLNAIINSSFGVNTEFVVADNAAASPSAPAVQGQALKASV